MKLSIFAEDEALQPLPNHELHVWALQLYIMLSAGIPLMVALNSIAKSELPRLAPACALLASKVTQGHTLSDAMTSVRPTFNPFVISLVSIGESSGQLSDVLKRVSQRAARRDKLERQLKGSLAYPCFLAVVSIGMALFMAFYMFPKLLPFLTGLGVPLPWPTRALIWATDSLSSVVLIVTILIVGASRMLATSPDSRMQRVREWLLFESPVIGGINSDRIYSDSLSDLQLLLEAGCDLLVSLKSIHVPWPDYNRRVLECVTAIKEGLSFSEAVEVSEMLPRTFFMQVKSGEETGQLPRIFEMLSAHLDESVTLRIVQVVQIVEPGIFLVMGFITGFVVLATFLPLYSLASTAL